ncbi:hypothetical protein C5689_08630 [Methylosinus sporium]|uniref:Uncharacterized protein n=1 Tax=Methylosinus sporium TaxID=428 RepID=A0A2U1SS05_METSR|nr:hypothetical protein C5689_08630 [Methylosinus sporium]
MWTCACAPRAAIGPRGSRRATGPPASSIISAAWASSVGVFPSPAKAASRSPKARRRAKAGAASISCCRRADRRRLRRNVDAIE